MRNVLKKLIYNLALLFFGSFTDLNAQGQPNCGFNRDFFDSSYIHWYQKAVEASTKTFLDNRGKVSRDTEFVVPVVFHFIHHPNFPPDKLFIVKALAEINADFSRLNADTINLRSKFKSRAANAKIRFVLVDKDENGQPSNGYTARSSLTTFGVEPYQSYRTWHNMKFDTCGGISPWNTNKYLNIWVCSLKSPKSGRTYWAGFATPPKNAPRWGMFYRDSSIDGIVLDQSTYSNSSRSSTLTHEIGHYLGLRHVSGDPPAFFDSATMCSYDDSLFDTPRVLNQNYYTCDTTLNSCIEPTNDFPDMLENFMDYTGDRCRNTFTKQQVSLMRYCLNTLRPQLPKLIGTKMVTTTLFLLDVYPNPNKGSLNVDFKDPFSQGYSAFIYDCLGRKVVESPITQPKSILNLDGLSTGWYQLTIVNNQFEIVYRKSIYKD